MENKLISVVVPVFNMGNYLEKAITALLEQSYECYEIIIIDDGSTDGSDIICDKQAERSSTIRVIHKTNGGLSSARNCGINNAKGEFIIFPDPDDWVDPDYLKSLMELHYQYNADLEICGHFVTYSSEESIHNKNGQTNILSKEDALEYLLQPFYYCGFAWNKLYHMDIIKQFSLQFDEELGMAQDLHFAFRYICLVESIAYNPEPFYHYYQESGGVTSVHTALSERKISGLKTYEKIAELAHGQYPRVESQAYATLFNMSMHFVYIYYSSKMSDTHVLALLRSNLKQYNRYFFDSCVYSRSHKFLGRVALISPKLYYGIKRVFSKAV